MNFASFTIEVFRDLPIRAKTLETYNSVCRCHIMPALRHKEIENITRADIQGILKPLPPQTAAMTLAVIKTIYREAIARELVEHSPAINIRSSRIQVIPRKFLTVDELERCDLGKYRTQILFLAYHGLRWGEAVALTEEDIRDNRVHVTKSIHGQTKSRSGIRVVPYLSTFEQFPTTPKAIRKICHENEIHIHSLRHTYAYLLKASGVHVTTAQRLLGHADPRVTLGIYTQFRDNEIEDAADMIKAFKNKELVSV
ncbi:MAG: tyrosine-type recombinase/integrase [Actinomycetota bacterium]